MADSIQKLQKRYEKINRDREELRLRNGEATWRRVSLFTAPASSIRDEARVYGRETERDEIVARLAYNANCPDLRIFSIVGCAGVGKTTLARDVFDSDTATKFFGLKIWVGLSQENDVVMATRKIIESVAQEECHFSSFDLMQRRLREIVTGKRFLIVLDNVCNEELDFWERLQAPMAGNGATGSAVLVTTRSKMVSRNMQARSFWLKGLPFPHCWSLFLDRAFPSAEGRKILEEDPELERIGSDIVWKCQGLPLLVKLVGSLLYSERDVDEWRCVRDEMPENEEASRSILPTLRVSYDHLPLHLKHCFAFCSVFPVGYEFDKDELVKLWVALGFIKPSGRRRAEDIGAKYFTDLLWRSFFHSSDSLHGKQMYKMPSVIRDLAKSVSRFECAGIDEIRPDKYKEARYIMLSGCNLEHKVLERVFENKCLRALTLHGEGGMLTGDILSKLFQKLRYLRVLDLSNTGVEELPGSIGGLILLRHLNLSGTEITTLPETAGNLYNLRMLELRKCHELVELPYSIGNLKQLEYLGLYDTGIESLPESISSLDNLQTLELGGCHQLVELPDSIGNLKQLRYLGLYNTTIERLPDSVSRLCTLQTLELGKCYNLRQLPNDISSLINLRYLGLHLDWNDWDRGTNLISMPLGIDRLTSLQTLSRFVVGSRSSIGVLRDLNLRGELCISNLENVVAPSDAEEANLSGKRCIDAMMLRWSEAACSASQNGCVEEVIDRLCPNANLKHLWIENYSGDQLPYWMRGSYLMELETLRLRNWRRCESLPFMGNFQSLKALQIEGFDGIDSIDQVFSAGDSASLEENGDMGQLSELVISHFPRLRNLSYLPQTLTKLEITDCPRLNWDNNVCVLHALQDLVVVGGNENTISWIEHLTSLVSLTISQFSVVDFTLRGITSLRHLKIQECDKLKSLSQHEGLQSLASLEYLEISSCQEFSSFPEGGLPPSLKDFRLLFCGSLSSWPHALNSLNSLRCIEIQNLPRLKSLTALPGQLQCLKIRGSPTLQLLCQEGGDEIRKIPCLDIESVSLSWFMKIAREITSRTGWQFCNL